MFFKSNHLHKYESIYIKDLHGYVLPHAGTEHSGTIISHTMRFKPTKKFTKVMIIFLPSYNKPNTTYKGNRYYHEYLVPWRSCEYFYSHMNLEYIPINILDNPSFEEYDKDTIYIVSADFSHFLPLQKSIELENKAAKSMMFRDFRSTPYNKIVDHKLSFKYLYQVIPQSFVLQWIGRTRSHGLKGVGYLSFLIREQPNPKTKKPNGIFVTVYDKDMNSRECLGEWFDSHKVWSRKIEKDLVKKVIHLSETTSRLTGGQKISIPLTHYTITYLYKKTTQKMIRGWHGIQNNAFYLSDVFLENTHSNGGWILPGDRRWERGTFSLSDTLKKLNIKSGIDDKSKKYTLYENRVIHLHIKH